MATIRIIIAINETRKRKTETINSLKHLDSHFRFVYQIELFFRRKPKKKRIMKIISKMHEAFAFKITMRERVKMLYGD